MSLRNSTSTDSLADEGLYALGEEVSALPMEAAASGEKKSKDDKPGKDGKDGKDDKPGKDGKDGKDDKPGKEGKDDKPGKEGKGDDDSGDDLEDDSDDSDDDVSDDDEDDSDDSDDDVSDDDEDDSDDDSEDEDESGDDVGDDDLDDDTGDDLDDDDGGGDLSDDDGPVGARRSEGFSLGGDDMLDFGGNPSDAGDFGSHGFTSTDLTPAESGLDFSGLGAGDSHAVGGFEMSLPALGEAGADDGWLM
jgi:hypothetical protein